MKLSLTTPRGAILDLDVEEVTAPGKLGEFGVLPGHVPLMSEIKPGVLVYRAKGAASSTLGVVAVGPGFLQVSPPKQADTAHDRVLVLVDRADHVEGLLGQLVVLAVDHFTEALHRIRKLDVATGLSGELLGDGEWLRQEPLNLARPRDD